MQHLISSPSSSTKNAKGFSSSGKRVTTSRLLYSILVNLLIGACFFQLGRFNVVTSDIDVRAVHSASIMGAPPHASRRGGLKKTHQASSSIYRYERKRVPFYGQLVHDQLSMFKLLSQKMKWEYTFNGTVMINDGTRRVGGPGGGAGAGNQVLTYKKYGAQVYPPLKNNTELFGHSRGGRIIWTRELFDYLIGEVAAGKDISCPDYPQSALDVADTFRLLDLGPKDTLLVGGSISPWIEAVAIQHGIGKVVTTDYSEPLCESCHERQQTIHMEHLMRVDTPAEYSHIISYSAIEHDGLGRYGDPMDPWGDMHAMKEFWSLLNDGGILMLAVPLWAPDRLCQLLARAYGPIRLPWLIQGWEYMGTINHGYFSTASPFKQNDWGWHPIIILRKRGSSPEPDSNTCTLDCAETTSKSPGNMWLGLRQACRQSESCGNLKKQWPTLANMEQVQNGNVSTWYLGTQKRIDTTTAGWL